jgi:hypothetical protein
MAGPTLAPSWSPWPQSNGDRYANAARWFYTNFNQIEIVTSQTADAVFDNLLATFAGVNAGDVARVSLGSNQNFQVTGVGQVLTFSILGVVGVLQPPFDVVTIRYDRASHTSSRVQLSATRCWDGVIGEFTRTVRLI